MQRTFDPNSSEIPLIRSAKKSGIKNERSDIISIKLFCSGVPVNKRRLVDCRNTNNAIILLDYGYKIINQHLTCIKKVNKPFHMSIFYKTGQK